MRSRLVATTGIDDAKVRMLTRRQDRSRVEYCATVRILLTVGVVVLATDIDDFLDVDVDSWVRSFES